MLTRAGLVIKNLDMFGNWKRFSFADCISTIVLVIALTNAHPSSSCSISREALAFVKLLAGRGTGMAAQLTEQ